MISEKKKLVECLSDNNWAVLNIDDKAVSAFRKSVKAQIVTYGFSESADLVASNYKMDGDGIVFKINYKGNIVPVRLAHFSAGTMFIRSWRLSAPDWLAE